MHIVWIVLKIAGKILLWLLGILLALLLIFLFVPIRYQAYGKREKESGHMQAGGKVSWLFSIISLYVTYEDTLETSLHIFGHPMTSKKNEATAPPDKESEQNPDMDFHTDAGTPSDIKSEQDTNTDSNMDSECPDKESKQKSDINSEAPSGMELRTDSGKNLKTVSVESKPDSDMNSKTDFDRDSETSSMEPRTGFDIDSQADSDMDSEMDSYEASDSKTDGSPNSVGSRISEGKGKLSRILDFIQQEEVKKTLSLLWRQIRRIIRHLLPTRLHLDVHFGLSDPSQTGMVTGILATIPFFYQKGVSVIPVFDESCFYGEFACKGRVRLGTCLGLALRIFISPHFWKLLKTYKHHMQE